MAEEKHFRSIEVFHFFDSQGDLLLFGAGTEKVVNRTLDRIRQYVAHSLGVRSCVHLPMDVQACKFFPSTFFLQICKVTKLFMQGKCCD